MRREPSPSRERGAERRVVSASGWRIPIRTLRRACALGPAQGSSTWVIAVAVSILVTSPTKRLRADRPRGGGIGRRMGVMLSKNGLTPPVDDHSSCLITFDGQLAAVEPSPHGVVTDSVIGCFGDAELGHVAERKPATTQHRPAKTDRVPRIVVRGPPVPDARAAVTGHHGGTPALTSGSVSAWVCGGCPVDEQRQATARTRGYQGLRDRLSGWTPCLSACDVVLPTQPTSSNRVDCDRCCPARLDTCTRSRT
jgi:hypothetical protein